jgi:sorbitol-specific phosphotransferase system component IIC
MFVATGIFYAALFRLVHLLIQLFIEVIEGDDDVFWGIKRHIVAMQVELLFIRYERVWIVLTLDYGF